MVEGAESAYFRAHPTTAALVVEVVVSSEALDRLKLQIYAEAGVRECWLVLAEERVVERHAELKDAAYHQMERIAFPGVLKSTVFPGLILPPANLFPA